MYLLKWTKDKGVIFYYVNVECQELLKVNMLRRDFWKLATTIMWSHEQSALDLCGIDIAA